MKKQATKYVTWGLILLMGVFIGHGLGTNDIPPNTLSTVPVFHTDFTDVILSDGGTGRLSNFPEFPFRTNINYVVGSGQVSLSDGILKMQVLDGMPTHDRCEFNSFIADMPEISNEYCVNMRIKLPAGYHLTTPHDYPTWNGWHEIGNPYNEWNPSERYYDCHLVVGVGTVSLVGRDNPMDGSNHINIWSESVNYMLPTGRFFDLRYYVVRHPSNGVVKVWVDNQLILEASNVPTMLRSEYYVQGPKLYGGEILPEKTVWLDSYTVYDQIPE